MYSMLFQGYKINVFIKDKVFKTQKSYLSHLVEIHIYQYKTVGVLVNLNC